MQLLKVSNNSDINNDYVYSADIGLQNILHLNPNVVKQYYIKLFDKAYLNFILNRQQRDLLLLSEFYKYVLANCKMQKEFLNTIDIVNNLIALDDNSGGVQMKNIDVFDNVVKTNARLLEKEMKYLKNLNEMFIKNNIFANKQDEGIIKSIRAKINKVSTICDESFLSTITKNKKIQKAIISKLPKITHFNEIKIDTRDFDNIINFTSKYN